MKILVTGFKAFNKNDINPTEKILENLPDKYQEYDIFKLLLNVEYTNDASKIKDKIGEIKPDIVLMMGLAGGRNNVNLEEIAVNVRHATIPDNKGELILNSKIIEGGPIAYESNLNIKEIVAKVKSKRFAISYSAGTYICNEIYYSTLDLIYKNNLPIKCGFIHFPFLHGQSKTRPTMNLDEMIEIFFEILNVIIK